MITLPPWWLLVAVVPVLAFGHFADARSRLLRASGVPPVIVGGLLVALLVLGTHWTAHPVHVTTRTANPFWLWPFTAETRLGHPDPRQVYAPFATLFFASIGLSATWNVARRATWQLAFLLAIATALAVVQNLVAGGVARAVGASASVALACGSLTLTGGQSTVEGWSRELTAAGYGDIGPLADAAATFGIVAASLLAGGMGLLLVRLSRLRAPTAIVADDTPPPTSFRAALDVLREPKAAAVLHLVVLLACVKGGAWLREGYDQLRQNFGWHAAFPAYMGALATAIVVRNVAEVAGLRVFRTRTAEAIAGLALRVYLAMAIAGIDLVKLRKVAGPMAVVLGAQVVVAVVFCVVVTWPLMGRSYDAAVMTVGHLGFALGGTPNAVASMDRVTTTLGRAPRAILVATIVGGFLIDITNSFLISQQLPYTYPTHYEHTVTP